MSLSSALHLWCSYSVRAQTESDRSKQKPEESLPVPTMYGPLHWMLPWMQVNGTNKISCGNMWNCSWNTWLVKDQRSTTGYTEGLLNTTDAVCEITASSLLTENNKTSTLKMFLWYSSSKCARAMHIECVFMGFGSDKYNQIHSKIPVLYLILSVRTLKSFHS